MAVGTSGVRPGPNVKRSPAAVAPSRRPASSPRSVVVSEYKEIPLSETELYLQQSRDLLRNLRHALGTAPGREII